MKVIPSESSNNMITLQEAGKGIHKAVRRSDSFNTTPFGNIYCEAIRAKSGNSELLAIVIDSY